MKQYRVKYDGEWVNIQRMQGLYHFKKVDSEKDAELISEGRIYVGLSLVRQDSDVDESKIELIEYEE